MQRAIQSYGMGVRKIGRESNRGADFLTHVVPEPTFLQGLQGMGFELCAR